MNLEPEILLNLLSNSSPGLSPAYVSWIAFRYIWSFAWVLLTGTNFIFGTNGIPYLCFIISRVFIEEVKVCLEYSPASDSKTLFLPLNLETASIVLF